MNPTEEEIAEIFNNNKIDDLKKFLSKRRYLNTCNSYLAYLFYLVQSSGILVTTIGTGYNNNPLIWTGVGLNIVASLIHSYEQINNNMSAKLFKNIQNIKNNNYVDEDVLIDPEEKKNIK
jgi:hypothetical protein